MGARHLDGHWLEENRQQLAAGIHIKLSHIVRIFKNFVGTEMELLGLSFLNCNYFKMHMVGNHVKK